MRPFYILTSVKHVSGHQLWKAIATSKEHALEKYQGGDVEFVSEEIEVTDSEPVGVDDIEEVEEE